MQPPARVSVTTPTGEQTYAEYDPCPKCGGRPCPCPKCHGAEWVLDRRTPEWSPSELVPCNCAEEKIRYSQVERVMAGSGIDKYQRQWTFLGNHPRKGQEDAWAALKTFSALPVGCVWLYGPPGSGKTTLALMAGNAELDQARRVLFLLAAQILLKLDAAYHKNSQNPIDVVAETIMQAPYLILDEYGRQRTTDSATSHLHMILNHRLSRRLPTVVTTNKELDQLDEAISSRVQDETKCQAVPMSLPERAR